MAAIYGMCKGSFPCSIRDYMCNMQCELVLDIVIAPLAQHLTSLRALNALLRSCRTLAAHRNRLHLYLDIMMRMPCMSKRDLRKLLVLHNNDEIPRLQGRVLMHAVYSRFAIHRMYSSQIAHYCCPAEALQVALLKHGSLTGISKACVKQKARKSRCMRRAWLAALLRLHDLRLINVKNIPTIKRFLKTGGSFKYVVSGLHTVETYSVEET